MSITGEVPWITRGLVRESIFRDSGRFSLGGRDVQLAESGSSRNLDRHDSAAGQVQLQRGTCGSAKVCGVPQRDRPPVCDNFPPICFENCFFARSRSNWLITITCVQNFPLCTVLKKRSSHDSPVVISHRWRAP